MPGASAVNCVHACTDTRGHRQGMPASPQRGRHRRLRSTPLPPPKLMVVFAAACGGEGVPCIPRFSVPAHIPFRLVLPPSPLPSSHFGCVWTPRRAPSPPLPPPPPSTHRLRLLPTSLAACVCFHGMLRRRHRTATPLPSPLSLHRRLLRPLLLPLLFSLALLSHRGSPEALRQWTLVRVSAYVSQCLCVCVCVSASGVAATLRGGASQPLFLLYCCSRPPPSLAFVLLVLVASSSLESPFLICVFTSRGAPRH